MSVGSYVFRVQTPLLFQMVFWNNQFSQAVVPATGGLFFGGGGGNFPKDDIFVPPLRKGVKMWGVFFWVFLGGKKLLKKSNLDMIGSLGSFFWFFPMKRLKIWYEIFSWRSFSKMAISQSTWPGRWAKEGGWRGVRSSQKFSAIRGGFHQKNPATPAPPWDLQIKLRVDQGGVFVGFLCGEKDREREREKKKRKETMKHIIESNWKYHSIPRIDV